MTDRNAFGANTTTNDVLEGIDLTGKTVLITGGTSGLGAETARAMAAHGAQVIVTARSAHKAQETVQSIKEKTGVSIAVEELELGSIASIEAFAERINSNGTKIDVLINNAGIMACPEGRTEDGFELQFGTNHLGHFLMTCLIAGALNAGGRVVNLSSSGHQISDVHFDDIDFAKSGYESWTAYGQSKTANALFSVGLNKRLKAKGIEAFSVHPGAVRTNLSRNLRIRDILMLLGRLVTGGVKLKSVEAGAATSCYAATAPELAGKGGSYLANCGIPPVSKDHKRQETVVWDYAIDPEAAERLWEMSEKMLGRTFDL